MAHWLFKSEPSAFSYADLVACGQEGEGWDGVRNYQASNFMKEMKIGDRGFFYHSVQEKQIVGIVEIIKTYHPDPTDAKQRFGMVSVKAMAAVPQPVTLQQIKADPFFADLHLVRHARLSVMPVLPWHWQRICELGGVTGTLAEPV